MKKLVIAVPFIAAGLLLSGCGMQDSRLDYEEAQNLQPDSVDLYNNIDGHPNLARVCIDGVAFVTTTRPDMGSWGRVAEWDTICAGVK